MFKQGIICRKIGGNEIGIVLEKKKNTVLVDGTMKKKYYNVNHLEPVSYVEIKKDVSHEEVLRILQAAGFSNVEKWKKQTKKIEKNKQDRQKHKEK